ncbi:hypothetical protein ABIB42_000835 [Massilia sp. UYP32]|jgi:hypothetical protein|uniref:DUF6973 domain-containing protein n=2 Tax=Massilia timonae TaxID=47229 RepID=K9DV70_9BURK|nr:MULTISPECIES: hypothetical protein [Massilia]EKU82582.1 hypothetical protein HMPREF9710_02209 [Massilia timonae CCUG 45783]OIJ39817.1 hypothetical protein LO55_2931 [Massilia timonae]QYG03686.1 hypothetical protein KY496_10065 [Massilia sp. NP310]HAK93077.1 hypothetical protein [Massilia timonae]
MPIQSALALFNQLTEQERAYLRSHPHHVPVIMRAREFAQSEARRLFSISGHNDHSDAFRHCLWSAQLARDIGITKARLYTTAHESSLRNPPKERAMDLHNNSIGLNIGASKQTNEALSRRCMAALKTGQLKTLQVK